MLVLTRRQGESIVIGKEVVVTVLEVRGGQVRLGVHAPNTVSIHRAEVYDQVVQENRQAVASAQDRTSLPSVPRPGADWSSSPSSPAGEEGLDDRETGK